MGFNVLVIEDEEALRSSVVRGLAKLEDVEVHGVGTVDEALHVVDHHPPGLVLSDVDLPGRSGVELLGELGARSLHIPIVFVTAYLKAYNAQIPRNAVLDILEKPVPLEKLREIVMDVRQKSNSGQSESAPFGVADYIQIAGLGRHSVRILAQRNTGRADEQRGIVEIVKGDLMYARHNDSLGMSGLSLLLAEGTWDSISCAAIQEPAGERNLEGGWEALLLDAARMADESGADGGGDLDDFEFDLGGPENASEDAAFEDNRQAQFEDAWSSGVDAVLDKSYDTALAHFRRALEISPGDSRVEANIRRLEEMAKAS